MLAKREKNNTVCDSEKKILQNQIEPQHLKKYMKHKYHLWS